MTETGEGKGNYYSLPIRKVYYLTKTVETVNNYNN